MLIAIVQYGEPIALIAGLQGIKQIREREKGIPAQAAGVSARFALDLCQSRLTSQ